jgi:peptidoglycan/xylan/chitin deacetylase (PgdA/CDA1 family)
VASRSIVLTFDVENDCSFDSFQGVEQGLPKILKILKQYNVPATFFVTAEVAQMFPEKIRNLSAHYEVGCHGFHHESLQKLDYQKFQLLKTAKTAIEEVINKEILGFRAPYLRVSQELFNTLVKAGFKYDSSLAWFKASHWQLNPLIKEYRLTFPNVFFRFPSGSFLSKIGVLLQKEPVLYFHPWEGLDVRRILLKQPHYSRNIFWRPDRWFNSGLKFISLLSNFIKSHLSRGYQFRTLRDLYISST